MCTVYMFICLCISSDTSSIDHLVMKEFVSGHLAIKGVREQFVVFRTEFGTLEWGFAGLYH